MNAQNSPFLVKALCGLSSLMMLGACAIDPAQVATDVATNSVEMMKKEVTTKEVNPYIQERIAALEKPTGAYPDFANVPTEPAKQISKRDRRLMKIAILQEGYALRNNILSDEARLAGLKDIEISIVKTAMRFDTEIEKSAAALLRAVAADRRAAAQADAEAAAARP